MIYISYYTKNTPYQKICKTNLHLSLHRWNLKHDLEAIPDLGSWSANTHYKAEHLKKMLLKHKQSVVFLDVDATIEDYPILFTIIDGYFPTAEISYHELDWYLQWRGYPGDRKEILSGTLYLNYTPKVLEFLDEWIKLNKHNSQWEQKNMQEVLKKWKFKLKVESLPYEYIVIPKHNGQLPSHVKKEDVIILHHQASRQYKDRRNWQRG